MSFEEKSGVVYCQTDWGRWWQNLSEVHVEIDIPRGTRSKEINVKVDTKYISVMVKENNVIQGNLYLSIHPKEIIWTIEDSTLLNIILPKVIRKEKDKVWEALMEDGQFAPNPFVMRQMRQKLDLEAFQVENPGMDFSRAKLAKCYDK